MTLPGPIRLLSRGPWPETTRIADVLRKETVGGALLLLPLAAATWNFEHRWRPLSASFAVPVFAFFASGVTLGGASGLGNALRDPVAVGVLVGLVVGKPVGERPAMELGREGGACIITRRSCREAVVV